MYTFNVRPIHLYTLSIQDSLSIIPYIASTNLVARSQLIYSRRNYAATQLTQINLYYVNFVVDAVASV